MNTQVVSALAGVHPNSGAVRLLLPRAPAGADAHGADESEHKEVAQGTLQMRADTGNEMEEMGRSGGGSPCRNSERDTGGDRELRRAICSAWRHRTKGRERGNEEEVCGFIAMVTGQ